MAIDLLTRDENSRWLFQADIDTLHLDAPAAVLAESMVVPDGERDELRRWRHVPIETGGKGGSAGARSAEATGTEATTRDAG